MQVLGCRPNGPWLHSVGLRLRVGVEDQGSRVWGLGFKVKG